MRPRQLCHQWCHFLVTAVGLVELAHPKELPLREHPLAGQRVPEMVGQAVDDALAPDGRLELGADVAPDFPLRAHEFSVDRLVGAPARLRDETNDLVEGGFDWLGACRGDRASSFEWSSTGRHNDERSKTIDEAPCKAPAASAMRAAALPWHLAPRLWGPWHPRQFVALIYVMIILIIMTTH